MLLAIELIAGFEPPAFLMGGLAEDVLLGAGPDRPHHDLDLLARSGEVDKLLAQLQTAEVTEWRAILAEATGRPRLLRGRAKAVEVEVYAADPQPEGGFSFDVPAQGPATRLRLFMPPDTFAYPPSQAAGLTLHTVSPLALALMRASSAVTRHAANPDKRAADLVRFDQLRQTFLAHLDAQQLMPRIEVVV
jgi:hypothetical protein